MPDKLDKNKLVVRCKRLPITIDSDKLKNEIYSLADSFWGETRSIVHTDVDALFVKGYPPIQRKPDEERPALQQLPYLREIIYDIIPGTPCKCVIAKLKPNGYVRMHRDGWINDPETDDTYFHDYFYSTIRLHIPVVTSPEALFFDNGHFFHMPAGEVWAVNNTSDHAVINDNPVLERTHIILDMQPCDELMQMLEKTPVADGWINNEFLARLMQDSSAPPVSPYAQGKPIPA
jgi:hypothetical protein